MFHYNHKIQLLLETKTYMKMETHLYSVSIHIVPNTYYDECSQILTLLTALIKQKPSHVFIKKPQISSIKLTGNEYLMLNYLTYDQTRRLLLCFTKHSETYKKVGIHSIFVRVVLFQEEGIEIDEDYDQTMEMLPLDTERVFSIKFEDNFPICVYGRTPNVL